MLLLHTLFYAAAAHYLLCCCCTLSLRLCLRLQLTRSSLATTARNCCARRASWRTRLPQASLCSVAALLQLCCSSAAAVRALLLQLCLHAARVAADKTAIREFLFCCSSVAAVRALLQLCCMLRAARFMADETATGERVRVILNI